MTTGRLSHSRRRLRLRGPAAVEILRPLVRKAASGATKRAAEAVGHPLGNGCVGNRGFSKSADTPPQRFAYDVRADDCSSLHARALRLPGQALSPVTQRPYRLSRTRALG